MALEPLLNKSQIAKRIGRNRTWVTRNLVPMLRKQIKPQVYGRREYWSESDVEAVMESMRKR